PEARGGPVPPLNSPGRNERGNRAARIVASCSSFLQGTEFSLGPLSRRGGDADVPFVLSGRPSGSKTGTVHLRWYGGRWLLSGWVGPNGPTDFEQLTSENPAQRPSPFDWLGPITADDFASAWQIDVEVHDRPGLEVLENLVQDAGRSIQYGVSPQ